MDQNEIDRFDHAILAILQKDNKTPQRSIAAAVGLSAPAVQRRIKRMEDHGIIIGNVAVVDPTKLNHPITLFVEIEMNSELRNTHDETKQVFKSAPEVQQCYYVTGEIDFVLMIVVQTMADYEVLTKRLFFANDNIKRFRTFVAMDRVKVGLEVPVKRR